MDLEILDIEPRELKFVFELKKQSSCTVRLVNKCSDYVAFKVKTTSPKKYCVRPNVGVIDPKSFCEFNVTMQAPKVAPPDMICKDKFLVQSTVVPAETNEDDITSSMFYRDNGRYVEEVKLRVILLSPPNSPILSPINDIFKQDSVHKASSPKDHVLHKPGNVPQNNHVSEDVVEIKVNESEAVKPANNLEYKPVKEVENLVEHADNESIKESDDLSKYMVYESVKGDEDPAKKGDYKLLDLLNGKEDPMEHGHSQTHNYVKYDDDDDDPEQNKNSKTLDHVNDEVDLNKNIENEASKTMQHLEKSLRVENKKMETRKEPTKDAENRMMGGAVDAVQGLHQTKAKAIDEAKIVNDVEEMKSKLNTLELKLTEAEVTISKLTEEKRWKGLERESLREELASARSKRGDRKVQLGFPLLYVCMVALVSAVFGYTLRC